MSLFQEVESACSCVLPAGAYGSHGWHWASATIQHLILIEKRMFADERKGMPRAALREEWESWLDRETRQGRAKGGVHDKWRPYIGLPIAMERCKPYMEVYKASLEAEKRRVTASTKKRKVYGEEE